MPTLSDCTITTTSSLLHSSNDLQIIYDPPADGPTKGCFAPWRDLALSSAVIDPLQSRFTDGLFTHQHAAIRQALAVLENLRSNQE